MTRLIIRSFLSACIGALVHSALLCSSHASDLSFLKNSSELWKQIDSLAAETSVQTEFSAEYLQSDPSLDENPDFKTQDRSLNFLYSNGKFHYTLKLVGGETGKQIWHDAIAYDGKFHYLLDFLSLRLSVSENALRCSDLELANSAVTLPFAFLSPQSNQWNHSLVSIPSEIQSPSAWEKIYSRAKELSPGQAEKNSLFHHLQQTCIEKNLQFVEIPSPDGTYSDWVAFAPTRNFFPMLWLRKNPQGQPCRSYVITELTHSETNPQILYPKTALYQYWDDDADLMRTDTHTISTFHLNKAIDDSEFSIDPSLATLILDVDHDTAFHPSE